VSTEGVAGAIIRASVAEDYPALCAAATHCGPAAQACLPDAETFAVLVRNVPLPVAVNGDTLVGYLLASPLAYDDDAPVSLWIEALAVVPGWRRQGLASALCAALASSAHTLGVRALLTSPPPDPASAALLARVGFVAHRDDVLLWRLDGESP
jgi:GNAT superfamily N-acetyltransferase